MKDITIRNVHAIDGYRQGMSLISATNLLVEDCTFEGTRGTPPESGIDFEPDYSGDRLANISLVRVRTIGNHGSGAAETRRVFLQLSIQLFRLFARHCPSLSGQTNHGLPKEN